MILRTYSDAYWADDPSDCLPTTASCIFLGYSLISWHSKKQTLTTHSSIEVEYRTLTDTTSEISWLHWPLVDLEISLLSSADLYCDNCSSIQIVYNDVFHEGIEHIEIDYNFIRQHLLHGDLHLV